MRKIKLDAEEKKIMHAIERDEFVPITGRELREVASALAARKKDRTLTLRVNSVDIQQIQKMARSKGIHYQSYLAEVIHRVAVAI